MVAFGTQDTAASATVVRSSILRTTLAPASTARWKSRSLSVGHEVRRRAAHVVDHAVGGRLASETHCPGQMGLVGVSEGIGDVGDVGERCASEQFPRQLETGQAAALASTVPLANSAATLRVE